VGSVFGQMKFNLGLGKFRLRELDKAAGERTLLCLLHSMKEIYSKIIAKGGELDGGARGFLSFCLAKKKAQKESKRSYNNGNDAKAG